jgi:hypothetical protein
MSQIVNFCGKLSGESHPEVLTAAQVDMHKAVASV